MPTITRPKPVPSNPLKRDPTRTATLRRIFQREFSRRWLQLKSDIVSLIAVQDAFGIRADRIEARLTNAELVSTVNTRFRFRTNPQKVAAFEEWLRERYSELLLPKRNELNEYYWTRYIEEGYEKGAKRAFDQVRKAQAILDPQSIDSAKEEFLRQAFGRPVAKETVQLIAGRVFTDLSGVTETVSTQMSRTISDGLVRGAGPREIARDLNKATELGRKRSLMIARTEVVRAHGEGQLDAMEQLGVDKVGVAVEWSTAGDDRVCPQCQPLDGVVLSLKEARGIIPRHPSCRCAYIPANVGEPIKGQVRGRTSISRAFDRSIKAESSKRSLKEQRRRSRWIGADKTISKRRPGGS